MERIMAWVWNRASAAAGRGPREVGTDEQMTLKRSLAALLGAAALLASAAGAVAANDPNARFRGAPSYDLAVTNVRWESATREYSYVTFDLSWSFSWRAAWVEPAKTSVTGRDLRVENWDAAWVFVKHLPEKKRKDSIERNHWRHATLSTDAADHVMPAGATNTVGLTDDGTRGLGVFIYRDAIGLGANNFKGVKLRWLHGADKVSPAEAAIAVHPIAMVYATYPWSACSMTWRRPVALRTVHGAAARRSRSWWTLPGAARLRMGATPAASGRSPASFGGRSPFRRECRGAARPAAPAP